VAEDVSAYEVLGAPLCSFDFLAFGGLVFRKAAALVLQTASAAAWIVPA